jgi:hypothetical protein
MRPLNQILALTGAAVLLGLANTNVSAQEDRPRRGDFDPAQFQQRMMERYREALDVKSDDEWKIVSERIQKVMDARREVGFGGMGRGMFGRPPGRGGDNAPGDRRGGPGGPGGPGGFFGEPSAAAKELQDAIDAKASTEQLKTKLAKVREERKQKQAKLEQAQEELKKIVSVRQEAVLVMMGTLN